MRKTTHTRLLLGAAVRVLLAFVAATCLPKPPGDGGDTPVTLYGSSIMQESLERAIYARFINQWKQQHGQEVRFQSSFAGSETVTNQILRGAPADVAILSIERDAQKLKQGGFITSDWHS